MCDRPEDDESFEFVGEPRRKSKVFLTVLEARKTIIARIHGILGTCCRQENGKEAKDR